MIFRAEINVMPLKALLDPQGKTITKSMKNLGLPEINNVRMGKHITLEVEAADHQDAHQKVETACKKLLANPIMEYFEFELFEQE
ncbi:MAG: phosphoribosylformylglycinamidine synthase subunit PurS [Bacteroides sp.]|jgi:phosphoribosylformylglycinamidine synthase|nr:phosphoribosylformylglycinamidine synthase subunit PurS [Bacteroides sp.]